MSREPSLDLEDLSFVLSQDGDAASVYDRAAPRYEHFRELWLKYAGGDADGR